MSEKPKADSKDEKKDCKQQASKRKATEQLHPPEKKERPSRKPEVVIRKPNLEAIYNRFEEATRNFCRETRAEICSSFMPLATKSGNQKCLWRRSG
jgi:hypothetical protein